MPSGPRPGARPDIISSDPKILGALRGAILSTIHPVRRALPDLPADCLSALFVADSPTVQSTSSRPWEHRSAYGLSVPRIVGAEHIQLDDRLRPVAAAKLESIWKVSCVFTIAQVISLSLPARLACPARPAVIRSLRRLRIQVGPELTTTVTNATPSNTELFRKLEVLQLEVP